MEILINFIFDSELNRLDLFSTSLDVVFIMNLGLRSFSKGIHWVEDGQEMLPWVVQWKP